MSDEATTRSDETTTGERVGFCQDCGKPLTKETVRAVGGGAFCEPCLQTRLTGTQIPTPKPMNTAYVPPVPTSEPRPGLAAFLGFIPGVGAMYNGQFAKGIVHLVVFAVLVSLKEHVSDVFGLLVAGWIFYMVFEAYHTAKARRDGLPLPDLFGLNDVGEKIGFGKGWGTVPQAPVTPPPAPATSPATAAAQAAQTAPSTPWMPVNQNPAPMPMPSPTPGANWLGYVPPASASYSAGTGNAPYAAPVPPTPYGANPYNPGPMPNMPIPPMPARGASFPLVAIWLIGLGVLFMLAEFVPSWHVNGPTTTAIVLGAVAASIFVRRLGYMGGMSYQGPMLHMLREPLILLVIAVLFLLQGVHALTIGQTWPIFFIALGAVLLGERLGLGQEPYPHAYYTAPTNVVMPPAEAAPSTTPTSTQVSEQQASEQQVSKHSDERDGYTR